MSRTSSIGDSAELEGNLTLSDRLKAFKCSQFDPDSYVSSKCQNMNEKEIRNLCALLIELKKASAEEMRRSVYANYSAFIRTSREISDLEGQLLSLRNLLSSQSALVHNLAERARVESLWTNSEDSTGEDITSSVNGELPNAEEWLIEFLDTLEVLLAERRVDEAMEALDKGKSLAQEARRRNTMSLTALAILENAIREQRQKLADHLAETASQSSTRGVELRSMVLALKKLGDGPRAHTLLLQSHQQKLDSALQILRSSSTLYGGAYANTLSRLVFSSIAQATSDSLFVFGEEPSYTSELVTWAVKQTEAFALLLKRHVLSSSAAAGGLRVVAECIQICLGHCALLEARGLALSPVLMRHFRSSIEQALSSNLKRIEQSTAAIAAGDDWSLTFPPVGGRPLSSTASLSSSMASQTKLSSSANKFNTMVQDLFEDVGPLETLQLDAPALEGVLQVFNSYVKLLIQALPGSADNEENLEGSSHKIVRMAETETQQLALLANASLLADELIPRAAMKLLPLTNRMDTPTTSKRASDRQSLHLEQREWKRKLQRSVDQLRDSFCRLHALDLIFSEEGDIHLNALMYIAMDDHTEEPEWFPSHIFQVLEKFENHICKSEE